MKNILFYLLVSFLLLACSKEKRSDKAAVKMQEFVMHISEYAKSNKSDFIIIPQNGIELTFNNIDPSEGKNSAYFNAIDGIGVEELFYNGNLSLDHERLSMLQQIKSSEKILISVYVNYSQDISEAFSKNYDEDLYVLLELKTTMITLQFPIQYPMKIL